MYVQWCRGLGEGGGGALFLHLRAVGGDCISWATGTIPVASSHKASTVQGSSATQAALRMCLMATGGLEYCTAWRPSAQSYVALVACTACLHATNLVII